MSKSDRAKKAKNKESRAKLAVTLIAAFMVVTMLAFFVYISGLIPQLVHAASIKVTAENGSTSTVETLSVNEMSFYYNQVYQQYYYSLYGMDLDTVIDQDTGKTYRMSLQDLAAQMAMGIYLTNQEASKNGYNDNGGSQRYADMLTSQMEDSISGTNYSSVSAYISANYGAGMTIRTLENCNADVALAQEYQSYLQQFTYMPTDDAIQAAYDENPTAYETAEFNVYPFSGTTGDDGETDLTDANDKADQVADEATDADTFRTSVMDALEGDDISLASFEDDADPTAQTDVSYDTVVSSYGQDVADFLFADDTQAGDTFVSEAEDGSSVYVVMAGTAELPDEANVSYRTLTLNNDILSDEKATAEEIAQGIADLKTEANSLISSTADEQAFISNVHKNSDSSSEILSGGYASGAVASDYENTDENPISDSQQALGTWLFDEARASGDTYIVTADDSSSITIYYFLRSEPEWIATAKSEEVQSAYSSWSTNLSTNSGASCTVDYDAIKHIRFNN